MSLDDWDYDLPDDRIARYPADRRDASRLLTLPRDGEPFGHHRFHELPSLLRPGDLLVANNTRVMAARLFGRRPTGGRVELLVLELGDGPVRALARPARKLAPGTPVALHGGGTATIVGEAEAPGEVRVSFDRPVAEVLEAQGAMPLPPYLRREAEAGDRQRYQTIYAEVPGSAAAPTAGLHFTPELLDALRHRGIGFATVTLHVGIGTFRPLTEDDVARGTLHREWWRLPEDTARAVREARAAGGRVIAVGTTSARTLESASPDRATGPLAGEGETDLFIRPPYTWKGIDGLITNFHLPRSSLLMMVACLCGRERLLAAYREAVARDYRFYSYGDAMLLL
jgi:S-adenosylmethionine:tRNA ribosyltransferase-isomerase